jgi:hypothetical protein
LCITCTATAPEAVRTFRTNGHAGNRRLNKRWRSFTERGKNPLVANVEFARELAGWCWSLATM